MVIFILKFFSTQIATEGEFQMYTTLLVRLCDIVAPLVLILLSSVRKTNLFGPILEIQNISLLINSSLGREVI